MVDINDLPTELLEKILSYLNVKEKFQYERVCRRWQQVLFLSIRSIAFGEIIQDPFLGFHKHEIRKENQLYVWNSDTEYSKRRIFAKCGQNLRIFRGYVPHTIFHRFVKFCRHLHCIDIHISDPNDLKTLGETCGKQLTCVTLRLEVDCQVSTFLSECSRLVSLAIFGVDHIFNVTSYLFDIDMEQPELPQCLRSLRKLIIDGIITQYTLNQLSKFTQLEMIRLVITTTINRSDQWMSIMPRWSSLRALSLEVVYINCMNFEPLPPNLEYLALLSTDYGDYGLPSSALHISTPLPKLRELHLYKCVMSRDDLKVFLRSVLFSCPKLQKLSIGCRIKLAYDMEFQDEDLNPLLLLTSLKHLSLGNQINISDRFSSNLITQLEHLTFFGMCRPVCHESFKPQFAIPGGKEFWKAVRRKAISNPSELFIIQGEVHDLVPFHKPFPPNVTLVLVDMYVYEDAVDTSVELGKGFGRTNQWQKWTSQWTSLFYLKIDIVDVSFKLSALPKYLTKLTVNCRNEQQDRTDDPLTFKTPLPELKELRITHQTMSNSNLLTTLECIAEFCPQLETLCVTRENMEQVLADNYVDPLFQCENLKKLCINENIQISDELGSYLASTLSNLRAFGCNVRHKLGITCGPLFLKALVTKAKKGEEIVLIGGISRTEFEKIIGPTKIPKLLHIIP